MSKRPASNAASKSKRFNGDQSRPASFEKNDEIAVDPDGDVLLLVKWSLWKIRGLSTGLKPQDRRIRVSSRHLAVASPVFKTLLQPKFQEGNTLSREGVLELALPDDNAGAMLTLMSILHCRHGQLSRTISRNDLFHVATLVDKYDTLEAVSPQASRWLKHLERLTQVKKVKNPELYEWIRIYWVFRKPKELSEIIQRATLSRISDTDMGDVEIPDPVLRIINQQRRETMCSMISVLQKYVEAYELPVPNLHQYRCQNGTNSCDSMTWGYLSRQLTYLRLLPLPESPYDGFSIDRISRAVKAMEIESFCQLTGVSGSVLATSSCVRVKPDLDNEINKIMRSITASRFQEILEEL